MLLNRFRWKFTPGCLVRIFGVSQAEGLDQEISLVSLDIMLSMAWLYRDIDFGNSA